MRSVPFLLALLLVGASALALGADTPAAALFFSAALMALAAAIVFFYRRVVGGLALSGLLGTGVLFAIGLGKGWAAAGAGEYASLLAAFGVFAIAQIAGRDGRMAATLWQATIVLGVVIAGAAFIDFIIDPDFFWGVIERPYGGNRFSTPFLSANTAATFYGLIAILSLAELIRAFRRFEPGGRGAVEALSKAGVVPLAGLLLSLTCVFLTASRAGATVLAGALLVLTFWELFRGVSGKRGIDLRSASLGLAIVALLAVVFAVSGGLYADRFEGVFERENARAITFAAHYDAVALAPWLGHGLGGFVFINALIADAENARAIMSQGAVHNIALQWLLQGGLIGFGFVAAISGAWLLMMRRGLIRRNRQTGYIRAAIIGAVFVTAHGMVDYALEIPAFLFLFAWVCGLGAGVATGGSRTLGPSGGPTVSRAITLIAVICLLTGAGLSARAFTDRASTIAIAGLDAQTFRTSFGAADDLTGSPVRLEAIGDRALRLDPPAADLAAQAFARAAEAEPRDGVLEAKYAYARYVALGFLAPDAAAALSRSYYRLPYGDRAFAAWRLDFLETLGPALPASLREAAIREARAWGQDRRIQRMTGAQQP